MISFTFYFDSGRLPSVDDAFPRVCRAQLLFLADDGETVVGSVGTGADWLTSPAPCVPSAVLMSGHARTSW